MSADQRTGVMYTQDGGDRPEGIQGVGGPLYLLSKSLALV